MGDFNQELGKASNPDGNVTIAGCNTKSGAEMLKFLKHNEMKTLIRQSKKGRARMD